MMPLLFLAALILVTSLRRQGYGGQASATRAMALTSGGLWTACFQNLNCLFIGGGW